MGLDAWSLLNQTAAERILPAAEKYNMGISCATPLEIGVLATGPSQALAEGRRNFSLEWLAQVGKIENLCNQYEIPSWRLHCSGARAIRRSRAKFQVVERQKKLRRTRKRDLWKSPKHSGTTWRRWSDTGKRASIGSDRDDQRLGSGVSMHDLPVRWNDKS